MNNKSQSNAQKRTTYQQMAPDQPVLFTEKAYRDYFGRQVCRKSEYPNWCSYFPRERASPFSAIEKIPPWEEQRAVTPEKRYFCRPGFFVPVNYCFLFQQYMRLYHQGFAGQDRIRQYPRGRYLCMSPTPTHRQRDSDPPYRASPRLRTKMPAERERGYSRSGEGGRVPHTQEYRPEPQPYALPSSSVWSGGVCSICNSNPREKSEWKSSRRSSRRSRCSIPVYGEPVARPSIAERRRFSVLSPPDESVYGDRCDGGLRHRSRRRVSVEPKEQRRTSQLAAESTAFEKTVWLDDASKAFLDSSDAGFETGREAPRRMSDVRRSVWDGSLRRNSQVEATDYSGLSEERDSWAKLLETLISCRRLEKNIATHLTLLDLYRQKTPGNLCMMEDPENESL